MNSGRDGRNGWKRKNASQRYRRFNNSRALRSGLVMSLYVMRSLTNAASVLGRIISFYIKIKKNLRKKRLTRGATHLPSFTKNLSARGLPTHS